MFDTYNQYRCNQLRLNLLEKLKTNYMKKSIIIIMLVFLMPFSSFSQTSFGVFGGLNSSFFSDGFLKKTEISTTLGFHLGVVSEINLNRQIAFRPKLFFSQEGDREKYNGRSGYIAGNSIDYKLSYINLPLNFKFFSKPYIIVGPQFGYLLETKKSYFDFGDVNKKIDTGINFGIGYDFNKFFIEFNSYQGFTKLLEFESSPSNYYSNGVTNTVLQLSFGYYFK